jgi:hypothetical protein
MDGEDQDDLLLEGEAGRVLEWDEPGGAFGTRPRAVTICGRRVGEDALGPFAAGVPGTRVTWTWGVNVHETHLANLRRRLDDLSAARADAC